MKTKKEKIKNWLIEQGYRQGDPSVQIFFENIMTVVELSYSYAPEKYVADNHIRPILGVFKGTEFIKLPEFEDDIPEPKDKALQGWLDNKCPSSKDFEAALIETNTRIKDLEAAVARLEAGK